MPALLQPVAIVTGGSRGIGRAICEALAKQGQGVVVNYATRADAAQEVVTAIEQSGGSALAVQADIASADDRRRLLEATLAHFGRLDVLVNNAGISSPGRKDLLELPEQSWDAVLATNLKGPFFLTQAAALEMIQLIGAGVIQQGKIITISSISQYAASVNRGDYCIAKAGLAMLTDLYAARLADEKIQVFEIRPGIIASDMTAGVQEKYARLIEDGLTPLRRWGQPEDVAKAVTAITADHFPFSTGERFNVDGGFHIRRL